MPTSTWETDKLYKESTKMPETARPGCNKRRLMWETTERPDTAISSNIVVLKCLSQRYRAESSSLFYKTSQNLLLQFSGSYINGKRSWSSHIEKKCKKISPRMGIIKN